MEENPSGSRIFCPLYIPYNQQKITWLIGPYKIGIKVKDPLIQKTFTTIDPVTGKLEVTQHSEKKLTTIVNLVETTWLSRYPRPSESTYNRGR